MSELLHFPCRTILPMRLFARSKTDVYEDSIEFDDVAIEIRDLDGAPTP